MEVVQDNISRDIIPREIREAKIKEFINLKQGSTTVKEYSLKLVKISRYVTFPSI